VAEEEGNTASELVFDEYAEMVGRIFYGREWLTMELAEREGKEIEREFDRWLTEFYNPGVVVAVRTRRKGRK